MPRRKIDVPTGVGEPSAGAARGRHATRGRHFTPEERRRTVEAFEKAGLTQQDFAKTYGISPFTLSCWRKAYAAKGPKGLERLSSGPVKRRGRAPLALAKREAILAVQREHQTFGLKKLRDFLARFRALRVSTGSVRKTLRAQGIPPIAVRRRRRRSFGPPRRFERSRPNELWQSDITYLQVPWSRGPLYLVAFMDDFSRYVVSAGIHTHQKQEIVIEAFTEGSLRFGKPKEVLTDQGRQYFTWRGKNDFQRLLDREGVRHVVARAHHPQTVGKCERFWETVQEEFWEVASAKVRDLADARVRLGHFLAHYNHFRPHQSLEGMTPADRFFGAQNAVRAALEGAMDRNEYRLAVDEAPRKPLFLVGQIGDQPIALHGEKGRVVIEMPDGTRREMALEDLGVAKEEKRDERDHDNRGGRAPDAKDAERPQAHEVPGAFEDAARDPGPVAVGERGGEAARAQAGRADPSDVAGQALARAGGDDARGEPDPVLAALAAGGGGHGGGLLAAASGAPGTAPVEPERGERDALARAGEAAREGSRVGHAPDRDLEGAAGEPGKADRGGEGRWIDPESRDDDARRGK